MIKSRLYWSENNDRKTTELKNNFLKLIQFRWIWLHWKMFVLNGHIRRYILNWNYFTIYSSGFTFRTEKKNQKRSTYANKFIYLCSARRIHLQKPHNQSSNIYQSHFIYVDTMNNFSFVVRISWKILSAFHFVCVQRANNVNVIIFWGFCFLCVCSEWIYDLSWTKR